MIQSMIIAKSRGLNSLLFGFIKRFTFHFDGRDIGRKVCNNILFGPAALEILVLIEFMCKITHVNKCAEHTSEISDLIHCLYCRNLLILLV